MTNQPFKWKCGYMGATDFACHVDGWPKMVTLHRAPSDYELSITRPEDIARRKALAGHLTATHYGNNVTPEIARAFNEWNARQWSEAMEKMEAQPEKYGPIAEIKAAQPAPIPARAAHFDHMAGAYVFDLARDEVTA
jgi:hypothetical protein